MWAHESFMSETEVKFFFPNWGIGDAIVCNGLFRSLAEQHERVCWVTPSPTMVMEVAEMFSDLANITLDYGGTYEETKAKADACGKSAVRLGFFSPSGLAWAKTFQPLGWDESFYEQAGVPFQYRWTKFKLPEKLLSFEPRHPSVIVHQILDRNLSIRDGMLPRTKDIVHITQRPSVWDWIPEICSASELHLVDSVYLNLAESLYTLGYLRNTRLVFHRYAKVNVHGAVPPSVPPVLKAPWEIL